MLLLALALAASPPLIFADHDADAEVARVAALRDGAVETLAEVSIRTGYTPIGSVSPDGLHAVFTVVAPGLGHPERTGELYLLDIRTRALTALARGVVAPERPRFTADGSRVLFVRLGDQREPSPEASKRGELATADWRLESIALDGSNERTVQSVSAYGLNVAGVRSGRVVFYVVNRAEAALYECADTGGVARKVASLPEGPFARDFSVVGPTLIFATLADRAQRTYAVETLDLDSGSCAFVVRSPSDHLSPLAGPPGTLYSRPTENGEGLARVGTSQVFEATTGARLSPLASTPDQLHIAVRREEARAERLLVLDAGKSSEVPTRGFFSVLGFGAAP
jgi:hypothetical protein